jgi:hypothetical protein
MSVHAILIVEGNEAETQDLAVQVHEMGYRVADGCGLAQIGRIIRFRQGKNCNGPEGACLTSPDRCRIDSCRSSRDSTYHWE